MNDEELTKLVDIALTGEHKEVGFIRNINQRQLWKIYKQSLKKIIHSFKCTKKHLTKQFYSKDIGVATSLLDIAKSIDITNICIDYYTDELNLVIDKLKEYRSYLNFRNNRIQSYVFLAERAEEDLIDFRTIKIKHGGF